MSEQLANPVTRYRTAGFPKQEQDQPGLTSRTEPPPDHGEQSYTGSGRLAGMRALITGGDSGIGRAVAIERVFDTNLFSPMWITRAAIPHLRPGASIITTSSIQAFNPSPKLIDYAMTKAAQVAFTKALAQQLGGRGIRVNAVAPGPIWTPLIPATSWPDSLPEFGQDTPLGRAGQPAELAPAYVFLASPEASYVSGAIVPVTGGKGL